jgi:hypothetical protein
MEKIKGLAFTKPGIFYLGERRTFFSTGIRAGFQKVV